MDTLIPLLIYTLISGLCIPAGGLLARVESILPRWLDQEFRHFMMALGGGILLGAVTGILVPEGLVHLNPGWGILLFLSGGVGFFFIERLLARHQSGAPMVLAMLLDYIPEAIAMGGLFCLGSESAPLLALFIGLQNLPEGFTAYREMEGLSGHRQSRTFIWMLALAFLGPVAGLTGYYVFGDHPFLLGSIMLVAAGGILYLVFQDIAPQAVLKKHWGPPLGAVIGFAITLVAGVVVSGHGGV